MNAINSQDFRFFDLEGKTLLITGITRGIGRALLPGLLSQGLNLIAVSRGLDRMHSIREELKVGEDRMKLFDCDLGNPQAVEKTADTLVKSGIPIDGIFHNAAIDPRYQFEKCGEEHWHQIFQVNLHSAVTLTRNILPILRRSEQPRVLFTGSVVYELGASYLTAYAASKGAIIGVTRTLAHELKGTGITVNCIAPGAIRVEKEQSNEKSDALVISWQSVPRRLVPGDLLGLICLLLSSFGQGITGQTITVDGGIHHPLAAPEGQQGLLKEN